MPATAITTEIAPWASNIGAIFAALAPLITVVGTLWGVWLGGRMQTRQAQEIYEKQRQDRLEDNARVEATAAAAAAERKAFVSYRFARILENYTKACATVGSDHDDPSSVVRPVPDLKFPNDIEWESLGPLKAAEIRDFQNTTPLVMSFARGRAGDYDPDNRTGDNAHAKNVFTDTAARLGRTAWSLAEGLRKEAGLPRFTFVEDGWNYAAFIREE